MGSRHEHDNLFNGEIGSSWNGAYYVNGPQEEWVTQTIAVNTGHLPASINGFPMNIPARDAITRKIDKCQKGFRRLININNRLKHKSEGVSGRE